MPILWVNKGAVADRVRFKFYVLYSIWTACVIYPATARMAWSDDGYWSVLNPELPFSCGVVDFAGSGVVHVTGGAVSVFLSFYLKARNERFPGDRRRTLNTIKYKPHDEVLQTLGAFLLWLAWFGFNCGSMLQISTTSAQVTVSRVAVNTFLAGAIGSVVSMVMEWMYDSATFGDRTAHQDVLPGPNSEECLSTFPGSILKLKKGYVYMRTKKSIHGAAIDGILAGLVSITAGCATIPFTQAALVATIGVLLYHIASRALLCLKKDDSVNASAVHYVCGIWGLLASGLFTKPENFRDAYPNAYSKDPEKFETCAGVFFGGDGTHFGVALWFAVAITFWVFLWLAFLVWVFNVVANGFKNRGGQWQCFVSVDKHDLAPGRPTDSELSYYTSKMEMMDVDELIRLYPKPLTERF